MRFSLDKKFILFLLIFLLIIFTRSYNIGKTSRFIWDESSDLVSIHRIWVEKDITLIGPISEDGNKVFGSLTYYLLMPFAVLNNFSPISTTYGAVFWGIVTAILFLLLAYKLNNKFEFLPTVFVIFWTVILIPSRWAWNPNFMPFWSVLSILFLISKFKYKHFISGFLLALTIHHHFLGFYTVLGMGLILLYESIKQKRYYSIINFMFGALLSISPFIVFDLTHMPGLFLSRILYFNYLNTDINLLQKLSGPNILFLLNLVAIIYYDIKNKSESLKYIFVFLFSSIIILFTTDFYSHYLLASIPFLFVYLIYKRLGISNFFAKLLVIVLTVISIYKFPNIVREITWENDIETITKITQTIRDEIAENKLMNVNLVVLQSPDPNIYGRRYRDLLLIDDVRLLEKEQYEITDNLFVLSYKSVEDIRNDKAYEIKRFDKGKLVDKWVFDESEWKLYLLNRN
ncbi:MAG TPA: hypothetical protein VI795_01130 [Patescibacteria group bacterium]|nr:hypothetical protein [Patescibacteria group bacterium]